MKKIPFLHVLFFIFVAHALFSQQANSFDNRNQLIKTHYYSFEGNATQEKLDELQKTLMQLDFVTEVKIKYKFEKSAGQIIMVTKDNAVVSENQQQFSATIIKKNIIKLGFTPSEYKLGESTSK